MDRYCNEYSFVPEVHNVTSVVKRSQIGLGTLSIRILTS
jgi:hypothetical protein